MIPRGGAALVQHVMRNSSIPVLGHADGICHVFVDGEADGAKAARIVLDAKLDYPAACNAAETLLLHAQLLTDGRAQVRARAGHTRAGHTRVPPSVARQAPVTRCPPTHPVQPAPRPLRRRRANPAAAAGQALLSTLRDGGVRLVGGPRACAAALGLEPAESLHVEYGDNTLCVEVVDGVDDAVSHIARWGSGHTEVIVTEDADAAAAFLAQVDSACVFHNASSRFADGFRFGLGCEVGISTSRIHARGPVGLEGLLTMRWRLVSTKPEGHTVGDFASGDCSYTHETIPL